jgi:GLPGLI family protein
MRNLILGCFILLSYGFIAQQTQGRIVFERRSNLEKLFKDSKFGRKSINNENKIKTEYFELNFKDSLASFLPIESNEPDPMAWATMKNSCFYNSSKDDKLLLMNVMGKELFISDSLNKINWKVTESKRKIAGIECYKSIWEKNDSTRIYAWFTVDIIPSFGPEGIEGLPGMILGLATEDGSIIYFAKEVRYIAIDESKLTYNGKIKEKYTRKELEEKFTPQFNQSEFGKRLLVAIYRWL